ncbi:CNNM domain-containing protein [Paraferrimonas sp. SM1919]|uniref:CNNM domain-containing protein n=1 Tax=Paraferrimonas sp. SM1919 TaxID=2662263 RepID=UPI0013D5C9F1|nr:hemolysin family protein [Paraferrimonas sp. SM1919]
MLLLLIYIFVAIAVSFICSVFEAVLLSVSPSYIQGLKKDNPKAAKRLQQQKDKVDMPLSSILTLNTIAHTVGAAGAGAQAAVVFGDHMLGVFSAVLTLLILFFSEIIPKTIGASYWRALAPSVSLGLVWMQTMTYPLVWLSVKVTNLIGSGHPTPYIRQELSAMTELGKNSGELTEQEATILSKMLEAKDVPVQAIMTPRTVMFTLDDQITLEEYLAKFANKPFSRIPIYEQDSDNLHSYVQRADILLAEKKNPQVTLGSVKKSLLVIPETVKILVAFELMIKRNTQIALIVDEYGSTLGIITLEDIIESMMGLEIIDVNDPVSDMQKLARRLWKQRMKAKGIRLSDEDKQQIVKQHSEKED